MKPETILLAFDSNEDCFVDHDYQIIKEDEDYYYLKKINGKRTTKIRKDIAFCKDTGRPVFFRLGSGYFHSDLKYAITEILHYSPSQRLVIGALIDEKINKYN